jgi:PAS domain S-box-containing protein
MSDHDYRILVERCPDGIVVHHDGVIQFANGAAAALVGRADAADLVGQLIWDLRAPDGSPLDVEARASQVALGGRDCTELVVRDHSMRREAEMALAESEARYRLLADHTRDLISINDRHGRFVWLSPSYQRELGWSPPELSGTEALLLLHPDDRARAEDAIALAASGEPTAPVTVRLRHKSGAYVWHESVVSPLPSDSAGLPQFIATARNIQDRLSLETQLRDAQKHEALGRMASGVAHDANNILAIIRSAAESLRLSGADAADRAEAIGAILESVDRAASLTAQLISFSQRQHAAPEELPLQELIESLLPMLGRVAAPRAAVYVEFATSADGAMVVADRAQFGQMLVQLVANARDAMNAGRRVSIRTGTQQVPRAMRTRTGTIRAGLFATIEVMDDGDGMSAEVMAHLFEPSYTTKLQGEGSGLGLATVFGIVTQNGGGIDVDSAPGSGATFRVYWPATRVAASADQPSLPALRRLSDDGAVARGEAAKPCVLLVDDEPFIRRLTGHVLERLGCHVITAADGMEALQVAHAQRASLDAIVTDVRMPGMSGPELVRALIQQGIDLPVLFISGQLDAPIPTDYPDTVRRRFLSKPVKSEEMARELVALGLLAEEPRVR